MSKDIATNPELSEPDKYFVEQRDLLLQEITSTLDSILNNLNGLNISLENSIAVGKEFESVSELWKVFYDGLSSGAAPGAAAANTSSQDLAAEPVAAHQNAAARASDPPAPSQ
ncbi:AaceriAAR185Wp [[Ashbya] aceris (nom. inval.)]|nr:AaceriAAR185Wp [[Ashbya] aceris (nom. inval.)]